MLDDFVRTEGTPEVVQFSGGEPTIHPQIIDFVKAAKARGIRFVMINTNGKRIARDDRFVEQLAEVKPAFYFQFDGFERTTSLRLRGEAEIVEERIRALDRLAAAGLHVTLVPAIERGVNDHELGRIVDFAVSHPAVRGINLQPAFHSGRHPGHDPMQRMTIPDILRGVEEQTAGRFVVSDFIPVPCCFPTCNAVTYAFVDGDRVTPFAPHRQRVRVSRLHHQSGRAELQHRDSRRTRRALVLVIGRRLPEIARPALDLVPGVRAARRDDNRRSGRSHVDDHGAGLHGPVDLQSEEPDEVLQGVSVTWRQADSILRLQHRRLSRAGPCPARSHGAGPPERAR